MISLLGSEGWENAVTDPGAAEVSFENGRAVYNITDVGTEDWNVQLKQNGIVLEQGAHYKVTFKAKSSEARTIKLAMLSPPQLYMVRRSGHSVGKRPGKRGYSRFYNE